MGIFDNLDNVKPQDDQNLKLPEGDFLVEIEQCLAKRSQQFNDDMFIAEFTVRESSTPTMAVGSRASWNQKCKDPKVFQPALAGFIVATLGYDKTQDAETVAKEISPNLKKFGEAFVAPGIANGFLVRVNVRKIRTKGNRDFMLHTWSRAVKPQDQKRKVA